MTGVQTCALDRKSTRLNSSHTINSYAVFCLKKSRTAAAIGAIGAAGGATRETQGGRGTAGAIGALGAAGGAKLETSAGGLKSLFFFLSWRPPRASPSFPNASSSD